METNGPWGDHRADATANWQTGANRGGRMATGSLMDLGAQSLALPTGLVAAAFLTRQLGAEVYGLLTVAVAVVLMVEAPMVQMFNRITVKFVAEAEDWRALATSLAQAQLLVSVLVAAVLAAVAPALAWWLGSPELTSYLRLLALDIPVFILANAHRSTLSGRGAFGARALVTASGWLSRMLLIFVLVGFGLSVIGAILALIGASLAQLMVASPFLRLPLLRRSAFPFGRLWGYALPLSLYGIGMLLFTRIDLLVVKVLSGMPEAAGYYGAAQNLTIVPATLFAGTVTPPLLATLTRALGQEEGEIARSMARQMMRLVWCLLPFAAIVAGTAPEIVSLVYGSPFLPAAPLVGLLAFAAFGVIMISITTSVLTAAGRPGWTFALVGPLVPLALIAHLVLVPLFGPVGAAAATTILAWLGAGGAMLAVRHHCGAFPAGATIIRTTLTMLAAFALSTSWHTSGFWLIGELFAIAAISFLSLLLLRELTSRDLAFARSLGHPGWQHS